MTTVGDMLYQMGGVPVAGELTTGNVFFVDSGSGSNSNNGKKPSTALATLDYAIGKCTATNGDIIYVLPGHAETTTAIAVDVAGITIIGIGRGRARPTFTATTAATDLIDVTADNVCIKNIRLVGAASGVTALIDIAADDFMCENCSLEQAATPLMGVTVAAGSDRWRFSDCVFLGTAAGPDCAIDIEGASDDWIVERCLFNYQTSAGLDLAGIRSSTTDTGVLVKDCQFIGMDATAIDFNSSSTGLLDDISVLSNNATVAEMIDAGLCGFVNCRVSNAAKSGAVIPATTSSA
jgi:hypothetical protein